MEGVRTKKILCIGAGYVGGPTMAMIAYKCPDHIITVTDINGDRIAAWNSDNLPIYEPGLDEIVKETRGRNLFFDTDIPRLIEENDIIFVSVNTPTKTFGVGAGMASDLQNVEKTARTILKYAKTSKIVIEKSTLPVRTALAMQRIFSTSKSDIKFEVLSNPEFLAEGTAINDLEFPDRVLIGCDNSEKGLEACALLKDLYARWIPFEKIIVSNLWSSELSKLVANAFLAQRVSSINSISALCENTGADIEEVARAVGADSRIGSRFLNAGVGFGGSCFTKDILNLVYLCRHYGLNEVADYWEGVIKINTFQQHRFVTNILNAMFNTLAGKKICLLGFAFKANTGDTRESPAYYIAKRLLEENVELVISDPKALENAKRDLSDYGEKVKFILDPYEAAEGCHAIAVLTEWELYKDLDYQKIFDSMIKPAFLFDGRNIVDSEKCFNIGFNVYPMGKEALHNFG